MQQTTKVNLLARKLVTNVLSKNIFASIISSRRTFSRSTISRSAISNSLLLFTLFFSAYLQAANIIVSSSRNPVAIDDSFHLFYEADGDIDDEPDFSPLYNDFDVLSSSQSTNMRLINGNYSLKKSWDLSVIAKQTGKFTIPSIKFGSDLSPAIQITVHNNPSTSNQTANPSLPGTSQNNQATVPAAIFLENTLDKKETWVQSQIIYTIRLLRTVSIMGGSLTEAPETNDPDVIIHQISEDSYQTTRNNIRYDVFERRYAIFPQKSGVLKIKPMTFEGRVNAKQARTIFDQFRMSGQLKRLRSKPKEIKVNAAPAAINLQNWLPASNIKLTDEWSDDTQSIKTGEPITRTITILADGLTGVQLPDLDFNDINNIKQYPDKAVVENKKSVSNQGITGVKTIKVALIPASAGDFILPEIKLAWWNTTTKKAEVATIPEKTITAIGVINTSLTQQTITPTPVIDATTPQNINPSNTSSTTNTSNFWPWMSLFFAAAWLFTLYLFFKKPKSENRVKKNKSQNNIEKISTLSSSVKKHAENSDTQLTKNSLINWAKVFFNNDKLTNITQVSHLCCAELSDEIKNLNLALYSPEQASWNGSQLLTAFNKQQTQVKKKPIKETAQLKPLYQK